MRLSSSVSHKRVEVSLGRSKSNPRKLHCKSWWASCQRTGRQAPGARELAGTRGDDRPPFPRHRITTRGRVTTISAYPGALFCRVDSRRTSYRKTPLDSPKDLQTARSPGSPLGQGASRTLRPAHHTTMRASLALPFLGSLALALVAGRGGVAAAAGPFSVKPLPRPLTRASSTGGLGAFEFHRRLQDVYGVGAGAGAGTDTDSDGGGDSGEAGASRRHRAGRRPF